MELWQALLVAFGGNAALLLVIAFLGRSLVSNFLSKDLERFKIRFSKLHEKRAEVLAELYKLLVAAVWATDSFATPLELAGEPDKKVKFQEAMKAITEYFRFFDQHRIYLPAALCASLEDFAKKLRVPTINMGVFLRIDYPSDRTSNEKAEAWIAAWNSVQQDVPKLRAALEAEFRDLLGVTTKAS